jgi:hypothetical protein
MVPAESETKGSKNLFNITGLTEIAKTPTKEPELMIKVAMIIEINS